MSAANRFVEQERNAERDLLVAEIHRSQEREAQWEAHKASSAALKEKINKYNEDIEKANV